MNVLSITRAELSRQLGVSRTYVTLLCQGKKKPGKGMADRLAKLGLTANLCDNVSPCAGTHTGPSAQLVEHLTFNQGVTGSRPVRPTYRPPLADLLAQFLKARRQGTSPRTHEFYKALLSPFVNTCELTPESINTFLSRQIA